MKLDKTLIALALTLAATACTNQAEQAARHAASDSSEPTNTELVGAPNYSNLRRTIDKENNIACYTYRDGISCVKLDPPKDFN